MSKNISTMHTPYLKYILPLLTLSLLLSACSSETTSTDGESQAESVYTGNFEPASIEANVRIPQNDDDMRYNGNIRKSLRWMDKNGENTVIISTQAAFEISEDLRRTRLYAYQYYERDTIQRFHFVNEKIDSCICDCEYNLLTDSIYVADLNADEVGDVWFFYSRNDRCDVSPLNTRLRMWSGNKQLVIDGYTELWSTDGVLPEGMPARQILPQSTIRDTSLINHALAVWDAYLAREKDPRFEEEEE